ncbi:MAG: phosphate ABC transporter permease subunit PstC [Deltaproteobacteria bacterium CG11_big_fil_rev_8_21_14_0_20_47_16]|nr:MAG: phosphate ABC transporter permease subunit PstC [Deltaproteobacteria bacterium CG11_big_fil_rev_8_21_14_0_20_47_16]
MGDRIFKQAVTGVALLIVTITIALGVMLVWQSWPALKSMGFKFITTSHWNPVLEEYGILPLIFGTIVSSFLALCIAGPIGLGIAIFLSELAPRWLGGIVGFLVELLAAIPSVIFGLWGILYLVPVLRTQVEPWLIEHAAGFPLFEGPPYGVGMLAASLILAIMVIPILSSVCRDVLRAVPREQREAAYALGATRWEVIRISVVSYAKSGIFGALFLGLGRALGETMAVTMVIGNSPIISKSILAPAQTMASMIANEFAEASSDMYVSAVIAVALMLFVLTLIINGFARFLVHKTAHPTG